MSVLMEFAMFPTDKGASVSREVSLIIEAIRKSGTSYQLTPMGTIVETETMQQALAVLQMCHDILEPLSERIYSSVKFDIRKKRQNAMEYKMQAIRNKIGDVNE